MNGRTAAACVLLLVGLVLSACGAGAADQTIWDARARIVTFENFDGTVVTAGDGDEVAMGGGGTSVDEGGLPGDDWVASVSWIAPPDPSCVVDAMWAVGDGVAVVSGR